MTPSDRAPVLAVVALLIVALSPVAARAGEGDEEAARVLFAEGRRLAGAGDYAAACEKFEASYRLDPGIGTNFNLADCEEHLGRTASAWRRFLAVAAATKAAGQLDREHVARARALALEARLSSMVVMVPAPPPHVVVRRDGVELPPSLWGVIVPLDPGEHLLEASAPGHRPWSSKVAVSTSLDPVSVVVPALEALPAVPGLVEPPARAADLSAADTAGRSRVPRATVWLGSLGVASLVTGAVFAVKTVMEDNTARTLCTGGVVHTTCRDNAELSRHAQLEEDARRDRAIAIVAAGVGAAAAGAAGVLWWRAARQPAPARVAVRPALAPKTMSLAFEVAW
jgi:hypothetical protein